MNRGSTGGPGPRGPMGGSGAYGSNYGGGRSDELDKARAPYGFVPLSNLVVVPADGRRELSDQRFADAPFSDGICGSLHLELTCHTPLFVRGVEAKDQPFRLKDGWAIPGSSLRGMLRSVLEIATFSRMGRVNDHRYGVRDLQNPELYVRKMATIAAGPSGKPETVPLVSAGWLSLVPGVDPNDPDGADDDVVATIDPCSFAKVHYRTLIAHARSVGAGAFNPGARQSSVRKYKSWGAAPLAVTASVVDVWRDDGPKGEPRWGRFGKATSIARGGEHRLVFTGQPNNWVDGNLDHKKRPGAGNPKQHDFVFLAPLGQVIEVTRRVYSDFQFVHSDSGEQHGLGHKPNDEWAYWKEGVERGTTRMPVFFLPRVDERTKAASFGLAMMYRLPYEHTTRELVERVQGQADAAPHLRDLGALLFGDVPTRERTRKGHDHEGLRGRVRVGLARATSALEPGEVVRTVLGAPKASFYPSYVEQDLTRGPGSRPPRGADGKYRWKTWMDGDAHPRGWKRYRVPGATARPTLHTLPGGGAMDTSSVASEFRPLPAGTKFRFTVDVHNLRPWELGALVWAIDFGGRPELRHSLGLAKSLGYGTVSLHLVDRDLEWNDLAQSGAPDPHQARERFVAFMDAELAANGASTTWQDSRELHELLALATPALEAERPDLRHMLINHPSYRNEFVSAKKFGLVLEAAGARSWKGSARLTAAPRVRAVAGTVAVASAPTVGGDLSRDAPPNSTASVAPPPSDEQLLLLQLRTLGAGNAAGLVPDLLQRSAHDTTLQKRVAQSIVERLTRKWLKGRGKPWADEVLQIAGG